MTTRSSQEKNTLRGLFYAAQLGSKAAAQKVKETIASLRLSKRNTAKAAFITEQEIKRLAELTEAELREILTTDDTARIDQLLKRKKAKAAALVARTAPRKAAVVSKAHQGDDGSSLMAARRFADNVRLKARILAHTQNGNATPSEITFCKLAARLPRRRPSEANTLREWRAYAAAVESLKAAITETKVTF